MTLACFIKGQKLFINTMAAIEAVAMGNLIVASGYMLSSVFNKMSSSVPRSV